MEIFSKDLILGNFRASDYGLILGSFSYSGESEDELGLAPSVIEEFIGQNPVPIYLGQKYEEKLTMSFTLIKNPCIYRDDMFLSEKELRSILRILTGFKGYQWMKVINEDVGEDLWYKARISNVSYHKIGNKVAGLVFEAECDSTFAWSAENNINIAATAEQPFYIYNDSDDLNSYILPLVTITSSSSIDISITNITDNNWTSDFTNVSPGEILTIDSSKEIITSSVTRVSLLNDFNLHWIRLVPGKNHYVSNVDATITFKFRTPRKVGFTE